MGAVEVERRTGTVDVASSVLEIDTLGSAPVASVERTICMLSVALSLVPPAEQPISPI